MFVMYCAAKTVTKLTISITTIMIEISSSCYSFS